MFDGDDLSSGIKYILQYIFFGFVNHEWKRDFISELAKTSLNTSHRRSLILHQLRTTWNGARSILVVAYPSSKLHALFEKKQTKSQQYLRI